MRAKITLFYSLVLLLHACTKFEARYVGADAQNDGVDSRDGEGEAESISDVDDPSGCGLTYLPYRGCRVEYDLDAISTLCDERTKHCVEPEASCVDGWCQIPARSFQGGATDEAEWANIESEPRSVMIVPRAFEIMQTEVTFGTFRELMSYTPDTDLRCGDDCPVGGVNVFEAMNFANRLSASEDRPQCYQLEGCSERVVEWQGEFSRVFSCEKSTFAGPECLGFRLPSGREYELAARAGSPFCLSRGRLERAPVPLECGPRDPTSWPQRLATFCGNSGAANGACPVWCDAQPDDSPWRCATSPLQPVTDGIICMSPQPVRSRLPNPFGLYGMHGNIAEWTQSGRDWVLDDLFAVVSSAPTTEIATTPEFAFVVEPDSYVLASGAGYWYNIASSCGNTLMLTNDNLAKIARHQLYGFRLVRTRSD